MAKSKYEKELEKICGKYDSLMECYASEEYKKAYPRLSQLYKQEGLDIKRKKLMRSRRELKKIGMESLYATR